MKSERKRYGLASAPKQPSGKRRRLPLDEGPKIAQLAAEVDTATIINEDG